MLKIRWLKIDVWNLMSKIWFQFGNEKRNGKLDKCQFKGWIKFAAIPFYYLYDLHWETCLFLHQPIETRGIFGDNFKQKIQTL